MNPFRKKLLAVLERKDGLALENTMLEMYRADQEDGLCDIYIAALKEDWHTRHEDLAKSIQDNRCRDAVATLEYRALNCPEHLEWDDGFALARKCTWALADIGTPEARAALGRLAQSDNLKIKGFAQERLDRWSKELHRKLPS